nr:MAG TPA: resuscitation-promoting factor [Caudoviricetes sp.]
MLNIIALNANHNVKQDLVRQEAKTNTTENALRSTSKAVESLKKEKTTIESSLRETRQNAENLTKENQSLKVSLQNKREAKAAEEKKTQEAKTQQVAQAKEAAKTVAQSAPAVQAAAPAGCQTISSILLANGISQADLPYALNIAQKESSCNPNAVNPNGGACAYFQELPCGKWGGTGNIAGHIRGADAYAKGRYGGWAQAWASWQIKHWW